MKKVLIIGNPVAHGKRALDVFNRFQAYLSDQRDISYQGYLTCQHNDQEGIDRAILNFEPNIISIIGGDGTVNDVINNPSARKLPLHLIPAGSGNDFSRLINGELPEIEMFRMVLSSKFQLCDSGVCNNRWFLNGVGLGFDGSIARQTVYMSLPFSTQWKYWIAIIRNVLFYKSTVVEIDFDGKSRRDKVFMISVANGKEYGGGFRVSPESDPSDGFLNLVIIKQLNPFRRLIKIQKLKKGRHLNESFVEHAQVKKVKIKSKQTLHAHLDGELMSSREFQIDIQTKLRILAKE